MGAALRRLFETGRQTWRDPRVNGQRVSSLIFLFHAGYNRLRNFGLEDFDRALRVRDSILVLLVYLDYENKIGRGSGRSEEVGEGC
jgi:hypothetical protein